MAVSRKAMTEGIRTSIILCALIDAALQSLSQKSKIFASSLYTREPGCSRTGGFFDGSRKYQGIAMPVCALAPIDMQFFDLGGCASPEYPAKLETFQRSAQNGMPWIVEKAENHFLRQKGLDFLRKLL